MTTKYIKKCLDSCEKVVGACPSNDIQHAPFKVTTFFEEKKSCCLELKKRGMPKKFRFSIILKKVMGFKKLKFFEQNVYKLFSNG